MRLDISIKEKLVIYFVALGIISIASAGIYTFFSARKAIIDRSFEQLTSVREVKKQRLETFFLDRIHELELLAQSNSFHAKRNESKISLKSDSVQKFRNQTYITNYLKKSGYYTYIFNFTPNAKIAYINPLTVNDTTYTPTTEEKRKLEEVGSNILHSMDVTLNDYIIINGKPTLIIGAPIISNAIIRGVFSLGIPLDAINEIMLENSPHSGLGESGESYLVAADLLMRSTSRFQENSVLQIKVNTKGVQNALAGESGTEVIPDYRNITVLSSYCKLDVPNLDWTILAEIDFKEVMQPVYEIRNDIILISALVSIFLLIFASIISIRISKPLIDLSNFTMELSKGNYGKTLPVLSSDEIGLLTESFNFMSKQIKEQTKELRENEKRLHHFYSATRDGIILHDRGRLILVNQAICELTEFTSKELMIKRIQDIIAVNDIDLYTNHPDKRFTYESICYRKSGINIPVEIQENPIEYEGNIISSSVIRDISERVTAEIVLTNERKKRMTSFIDGQEDERKRLSRELHDGLAQSLIAMKMRLESIGDLNTEEIHSTVNVVKSYVNTTIEDVRRMSNNLMPSVLREFGLVEAIKQLCKQLRSSTGINISFEQHNASNIFDDRIKTYLYRITQEALNNAIKHSKANEISIILKQEETLIRLIIEDNGIGFDMDSKNSKGNGLYNMKERASLLQGNVAIFSAPGSGTVINAKLPILR